MIKLLIITSAIIPISYNIYTYFTCKDLYYENNRIDTLPKVNQTKIKQSNHEIHKSESGEWERLEEQ